MSPTHVAMHNTYDCGAGAAINVVVAERFDDGAWRPFGRITYNRANP